MTELDDDFRRVMISLTLLSHGSTQSWNADRVSGGEKSRQPTGESDPPQQQLWRRWMTCRSDDQRWAVLGEFADLLEAWTKSKGGPAPSEETWDQLRRRIIKDGRGWETRDVANALKLTPTQVRKARRETVRELAKIKAFGKQKFSVREISEIVTLPKSTVQDEMKRAA